LGPRLISEVCERVHLPRNRDHGIDFMGSAQETEEIVPQRELNVENTRLGQLLPSPCNLVVWHLVSY
jgi:hypothetical protein